MSKDKVSDWSTTAASNTDLGGTGISNSTTPTQLDDLFQKMMAQIRVDLYGAAAFSGGLYGLTLSNNGSDATNDIDIAAGIAIDSTNARWMNNASSITKRLDASWAVGTGNGGLDTGSIANTTYHVWLIMRSDTGVVDALFSTSASSPTMPANYDYKRRIGAIIRASSAILAFKQTGDVFKLTTAVTERNSTSAASDAALTLTGVPSGVRVQPLLSVSHQQGTAGSSFVQVGDGDAGAVTTLVARTDNASERDNNTFGHLVTNTSAQIRFAATISSGTIAQATLSCFGWVDTRGRLA